MDVSGLQAALGEHGVDQRGYKILDAPDEATWWNHKFDGTSCADLGRSRTLGATGQDVMTRLADVVDCGSDPAVEAELVKMGKGYMRNMFGLDQ